MKKPVKVVEQENGKISFYGGRLCQLNYAKPEWARGKDDEPKAYFRHRGRRYYLDEFMYIDKSHASNWMQEFDGYYNDSFFSGVVIKLDQYEEDCVRAWTFIS